MYDPTTSSLTVSWEPAKGPVTQYRITYAPTTGDPIEEYVSALRHRRLEKPTNRFNHLLMLCSGRRQYQQTETTSSCPTWTQTPPTTSR